MATGAAAVTVANSTSGIIVARSFRWLRKTAFTFRRTFNLNLPKTQVGSGTTWYLTMQTSSPEEFLLRAARSCGDLVATIHNLPRRSRLAKRVQPELSVGWGRIASIPRQVASSKEVVEVLVSAHRAGQPERSDRGFQIANYAACRTPAEVGIHRVEDRAQMLTEHPVRSSRQFKAGDIQKPHQLRML